MRGKLKTLNANDLLSAMEEMEFQRFFTRLKEALEAYWRELGQFYCFRILEGN